MVLLCRFVFSLAFYRAYVRTPHVTDSNRYHNINVTLSPFLCTRERLRLLFVEESHNSTYASVIKEQTESFEKVHVAHIQCAMLPLISTFSIKNERVADNNINTDDGQVF